MFILPHTWEEKNWADDFFFRQKLWKSEKSHIIAWIGYISTSLMDLGENLSHFFHLLGNSVDTATKKPQKQVIRSETSEFFCFLKRSKRVKDFLAKHIMQLCSFSEPTLTDIIQILGQNSVSALKTNIAKVKQRS